MQSFRDLIVWQRSIDLATRVYELTETFPATARFGLARQMDDAAISISSNIAEGYARSSQREWLQFLDRATGSLNELESQLELAVRRRFVSKDAEREIALLISRVGKPLNGLRRKVKERIAFDGGRSTDRLKI